MGCLKSLSSDRNMSCTYLCGDRPRSSDASGRGDCKARGLTGQICAISKRYKTCLWSLPMDRGGMCNALPKGDLVAGTAWVFHCC